MTSHAFSDDVRVLYSARQQLQVNVNNRVFIFLSSHFFQIYSKFRALLIINRQNKNKSVLSSELQLFELLSKQFLEVTSVLTLKVFSSFCSF